jgi:F-type H+-transporting ATPase subunit delta
MAEFATIARPYAEALFEVVREGDLQPVADQLDALQAVASDPQLRRFADDPKVESSAVFDLISAVLATPLSAPLQNLLRTVLDNNRLAALPEIARQFRLLVAEQSGVSDAQIHSAFPIDDAQLGGVVAALERRFGRKLNTRVVIEPELIGGIRVVVGDEVLDTSVQARLAHMKASLAA